MITAFEKRLFLLKSKEKKIRKSIHEWATPNCEVLSWRWTVKDAFGAHAAFRSLSPNTHAAWLPVKVGGNISRCCLFQARSFWRCLWAVCVPEERRSDYIERAASTANRCGEWSARYAPLALSSFIVTGIKWLCRESLPFKKNTYTLLSLSLNCVFGLDGLQAFWTH